MPIEFTISLVEVGGSLRMTVPKEIAEALRLKKGDKVSVGLDDHTMTVRKKER